MLAIPTEYPQVGSSAFLRPDSAFASAFAQGGEPEPVRIQRRNPDGSVLVSRTATTYSREAASGTPTVPFADLAPTREAALTPAPKRRTRRMAR